VGNSDARFDHNTIAEVRNDGGLHPQHKRFYDGAVRLDVDSAELSRESD
jgi:hypothetical protein